MAETKRKPGRPRKTPVVPTEKPTEAVQEAVDGVTSPAPMSRHKRAFRRLRSACRKRDLETALWQLVFLGQEELEKKGAINLNGKDMVNLLTAIAKLPKGAVISEDDAMADWLLKKDTPDGEEQD